MEELFDTSRVKIPSKSDVVPFEVPSSTIDAPGRGKPWLSDTNPFIVV